MSQVNSASGQQIEDIVVRLRETLKSERRTQKEIAQLLGVSEKTFGTYLRGRNVTYEFLVSFCKLMNINLTWLLGLENAPKKVVEIQHDETRQVIMHVDGLDANGRKLFLIQTKGFCNEWRNYVIENDSSVTFVLK